MSIDSDPLAAISTFTYQLKLFDQKLEHLDAKKRTPTSSTFFPPAQGKSPHKSEVVIQVAKKTILSLQNHLEDLSFTPSVCSLAPRILNNALLVLIKIVLKTHDLPLSSERESLRQSALLCKENIERKLNSLKTETTSTTVKEAKTSPGFVEETIKPYIRPVAEAFVSFAGIASEKNPIQQKIQEHKEALKDFSSNGAAETFAHSLREFLLKYLNVHLVHIQEEDPSLRPEFLSYFFHNPYSAQPIPKALYELVVPLLAKHKELVGDLIELNLLKGLHNGYEKLRQIEKTNPDLVVDFMRKSYHIAIKNVRKEELARKEQGINPLTIQERQLLLNGEFQKNITKVLLDLGFPHGANDLELPEIASFIPGVTQALNHIKSEYIWPLLQDGLHDLFQSIFKDLCFDEEVKTSLLIEGYSSLIPLLSGKTEADVQKNTARASENVTRLSMVSSLSIGVIAAFFAIIINAFKSALGIGTDQTAKKSDYIHQAELNKDIYKTFAWFAEGSFKRRVFFKHFGQKIANSLGAALAQGLREISITSFLDTQLKSLTDRALSPTGGKELFPMKESEEEKAQQEKAVQQKKAEKTLKLLRNQVGHSIDNLVAIVTEGIYPKGDETHMSKMRVLIRSFLRSTVFHLIRFIFWIVNLKKDIVSMEKRFFEAQKMLQQDQILMSSTSVATQAILTSKPVAATKKSSPDKI